MEWKFALELIGIVGVLGAFFWRIIDKRLDRIETKIEGIGNRLNRLEEKVSNLENRMNHLEGMLQTIVSFLLGHKTGTLDK